MSSIIHTFLIISLISAPGHVCPRHERRGSSDTKRQDNKSYARWITFKLFREKRPQVLIYFISVWAGRAGVVDLRLARPFACGWEGRLLGWGDRPPQRSMMTQTSSLTSSLSREIPATLWLLTVSWVLVDSSSTWVFGLFCPQRPWKRSC